MKQNEFYEVNGCIWFIPVDLIEIDEDKYTKRLEVEAIESGCRAFVPSIYKFSKPPEPQKVVVPKFVAEWITYCKQCTLDLQDLLSRLEDRGELYDWAHDENDGLISERLDMIARAWLDGYTVEKEKLYTVEIPNPNINTHTVLQKIEKGLVLATVTKCKVERVGE